MTYDDLLTRLNATLAGDRAATRSRQRLRAASRSCSSTSSRTPTPSSGRSCARAFGDGGATLVLIGDPKQAIYAFRGADVYAYLDAARGRRHARDAATSTGAATRACSTPTTRCSAARSSAHAGIVYRQVQRRRRRTGAAADRRAGRRAAAGARRGPRRRRASARPPSGYAQRAGAREHIAARPRRRRRPRCCLGRDGAPTTATRPAPVCAGRRRRARAHQPPGRARARRARATSASRRSSTAPAASSRPRPPASGCACSRRSSGPTSPPRARVGRADGVPRLDAPSASPPPTDATGRSVHQRLHELGAGAARARRRRAARGDHAAASGSRAGCSAAVDGERRLTDLRHVGQLLHAAAIDEQLGTTALAAWLRQPHRRRRRPTRPTRSARRRLESDAEAVQVLTIHRSKGLEFPIVYCPFLWDPAWIRDEREPVAFHDPTPATSARSTSASRARRTPRTAAALRAERARRGPAPRLRRAHARRAPGGDLVGGHVRRRDSRARAPAVRPGRATATSPAERPPADDADGAPALRASSPRAAPGCVSVEGADLGPPLRWRGRARRGGRRSTAARFDRRLDLRWRRTSYSDITAGAHEARVGQRARGGAASTTSPTTAAAGGRRRPTADAALARRAVAAGRHAGRRRASAPSCTGCSRRPTSPRPTCDAELDARVRERAGRRPVDVGDRRAVVDGLRGGDRDAARPARRRRAAARPRARATGSTSSSSSCRSPAATTRPAS